MEMSISELTDRLLSAGYSTVKIANLLGVSPLQAKLYINGTTKTPGVKTALAASHHITYKGEPIVLKPYRGVQGVLDAVDLYKVQSAQKVRDLGSGHVNLT